MLKGCRVFAEVDYMADEHGTKDVSGMKGKMMIATEPNNLKRFGIVIMVGLNDRVITDRARKLLNLAAFNINVKIASGCCSLLLQIRQLVSEAPVSDIGSMASGTVPLPFACFGGLAF